MATAKSAKNTRKPARSKAKTAKRPAARKTAAKPSAVLNEIAEVSVASKVSTDKSVAALANEEVISTDSGVVATKSETVAEAATSSKSTDVALGSQVASMRKVFKMNNMEIPNVVREAAEKTIEHAQAGYKKFKDSAEAATNLLEDSIETSRKGFVGMQEKVIDAAKANTEAGFDFCRSMLSVKSFSEALELQSGFAKQQYDTVASQGKDLQDMTSKLVENVTSPAKEAFDKAFSEMKAA